MSPLEMLFRQLRYVRWRSDIVNHSIGHPNRFSGEISEATDIRNQEPSIEDR